LVGIEKHDADRYCTYNLMISCGPAYAWVTFYDYIILEQKKPLKSSFRGLGITKVKKIFKA